MAACRRRHGGTRTSHRLRRGRLLDVRATRVPMFGRGRAEDSVSYSEEEEEVDRRESKKRRGYSSEDSFDSQRGLSYSSYMPWPLLSFLTYAEKQGDLSARRRNTHTRLHGPVPLLTGYAHVGDLGPSRATRPSWSRSIVRDGSNMPPCRQPADKRERTEITGEALPNLPRWCHGFRPRRPLDQDLLHWANTFGHQALGQDKLRNLK